MTDSALEVALVVANIFDELDVDYVVVGSLASSLHGEPRSTQDVDFVAALTVRDVKPFLEGLGSSFYADPERVLRSVSGVRSFNVIHLQTMFKVDIFIHTGTEAAKAQMGRRQHYEVAAGRSLAVASAEDVVVQKLNWYRQGGEVSDRQWRDILSVLKINQESLDLGYMKSAAEDLDVEDLLDKALQSVDD